MGRTAIIVQARAKSTRLPGKVLLDLGGTSVLDHVLTRCQAVAGVDVVVCAVPEGEDDDPVAAEAERCGAVVCRGSEHDVLDRYYRAAVAVGCDVIMRVTSDCPMIDPAVCAAVLRLREETGADYASNNMPPSWPHGLDCGAFPMAWLERSAREARRPSEREHVTPYLIGHPEARRVNLACPVPEVSFHRWTLDTPDDLLFFRAIWPRLPAGRDGWDWRAALAVVMADPSLAAINAGHDRDAGLKTSLAKDAACGFVVEPMP